MSLMISIGSIKALIIFVHRLSPFTLGWYCTSATLRVPGRWSVVGGCPSSIVWGFTLCPFLIEPQSAPTQNGPTHDDGRLWTPQSCSGKCFRCMLTSMLIKKTINKNNKQINSIQVETRTSLSEYVKATHQTLLRNIFHEEMRSAMCGEKRRMYVQRSWSAGVVKLLMVWLIYLKQKRGRNWCTGILLREMFL